MSVELSMSRYQDKFEEDEYPFDYNFGLSKQMIYDSGAMAMGYSVEAHTIYTEYLKNVAETFKRNTQEIKNLLASVSLFEVDEKIKNKFPKASRIKKYMFKKQVELLADQGYLVLTLDKRSNSSLLTLCYQLANANAPMRRVVMKLPTSCLSILFKAGGFDKKDKQLIEVLVQEIENKVNKISESKTLIKKLTGVVEIVENKKIQMFHLSKAKSQYATMSQ